MKNLSSCTISINPEKYTPIGNVINLNVLDVCCLNETRFYTRDLFVLLEVFQILNNEVSTEAAFQRFY